MRESAVPCQVLGCRMKSWRYDGLCNAHANQFSVSQFADRRAPARRSAAPVGRGGHRGTHLVGAVRGMGAAPTTSAGFLSEARPGESSGRGLVRERTSRLRSASPLSPVLVEGHRGELRHTVAMGALSRVHRRVLAQLSP